jgi:predicted TIM-barrel fold metal-dependent hydrolase
MFHVKHFDQNARDEAVTTPIPAIDCDIHPTLAGMEPLLPYFDDIWADHIRERGIESLDNASYAPNSPLAVRPDWRDANGLAATDAVMLARDVLDPSKTQTAILNCLAGVQLPHNVDFARAAARAVNDWIKCEWLDKDARLRASILVTPQNIDFAVEEIERCAPDRRFVQVMLLAMGEHPLGKRMYWPIYAVAEKYGLPIGIHAGSSFHHPVTSLGWNNFHIEDCISQSFGFQAQVASLITEGVFVKYPKLKVVLIESGVSWAPAFLWRLTKFWRGMRSEVPWVDRAPWEIFRDHIRMTITPLDAPDTAETVARLADHLHSDEILLYSSDYPHWQFDGGILGDSVLPAGLSEGLRRKIMVDNPLATYPRCKEAVQ